MGQQITTTLKPRRVQALRFTRRGGACRTLMRLGRTSALCLLCSELSAHFGVLGEDDVGTEDAQIGNDDAKPCSSDPLATVRNEMTLLTADTLERMRGIIDPRADGFGDRFAMFMARDVADALLALFQTFYMQQCILVGCHSCAVEINPNASDSSETLQTHLKELGLEGKFHLVADRIIMFAETFDSAADFGHHEDEMRRESSPLLDLRRQISDLRADIEKIRSQKDFRNIDMVFGRHVLGVDLEELGVDKCKERILQASMLGRSLLSELHARVADIINVAPQLGLEARHLPGMQNIGAHGYTAQFLNHDATRTEELVALLQGNQRVLWPFVRSSAICTRSDWLSLPTPPYIPDRPYRDPSGHYVWDLATPEEMLKTVERAGYPLYHNYWAIRAASYFGKEMACERTVGALADTTRCLDEEGWGGSIYFVNPDPNPREKERLYIQWRPRAWNMDRTKENPLWKAYLDPITPPSERMDLVSLSLLAGNCELLKTMLTADSMTFARLVYAPINPVFPPPLEVVPNYTAFWLYQRSWSRDLHKKGLMNDKFLRESQSMYVMAQCSLQSTYNLLAPLGYELLHVEHIHAVFAHSSVAHVLRRRMPKVAAAPAAPLVSPSVAEPPDVAMTPFEAWRQGWYCQPYSRYAMDLEVHGGFDVAWLDPSAAIITESFCQFLSTHAHLTVEEIAQKHPQCSDIGSVGGEPAAAQAQVVLDGGWWADRGDLQPAARRKKREIWAAAVPTSQSILQAEILNGRTMGDEQKQRANCGGPGLRAFECVCLAPWRGADCREKDQAEAERLRPYRAALVYVVDVAIGVEKLADALVNLWTYFNQHREYPVFLFHKVISKQHREHLAVGTPNRLWFYRGGAGHKHPALVNLDLVWRLDTESRFTSHVKQDPLELMHLDWSIALAFGRMSQVPGHRFEIQRLWELTLLYLSGRGLLGSLLQDNSEGNDEDHSLRARLARGTKQVTAEQGRFLATLLPDAAPGNELVWNRKVVDMGCAVFRNSAFNAKESRYADYVNYIEAHLNRFVGTEGVRGGGGRRDVTPKEGLYAAEQQDYSQAEIDAAVAEAATKAEDFSAAVRTLGSAVASAWPMFADNVQATDTTKTAEFSVVKLNVPYEKKL